MATGNAASTTTITTSTVLVSNIHCASCVLHIHEILKLEGDRITDVNVNVVSGQVQVTHSSALATLRLCELLDGGAFEVYSATSKTQFGQERVVFPADEEDLGKGKGRQSPSTESLAGDRRCLRLPDRKMHIKNCDACKREAEVDVMELQDMEQGDVDLEKFAGLRPFATANERLMSDETLVDHNAQTANSQEKTLDNTPGRRQAILSVSGMTCASCTNAIDHGLRQLDFVEDVDVSLLTNSAVVTYKAPANANDIRETIDDLGYDCEIDQDGPLDPVKDFDDQEISQGRTIRIQVDGMYCKHCPPRVTGILGSIYGSDVHVEDDLSLANPILTVTYTPRLPHFTIRHLLTTINSSDRRLNAKPYHPPSIEARSQKMQRREANRLLLRIILSFVVAIPTFLIGVIWMSLVSSSNPTRMYFEDSVWAGSVARRDWALFVLATPVMFLAADVFHVRAIKEIRSLWRPGNRVPIMQRFYRFGSMNLLVSAGTSVAYFSSVAILAIDATTKMTKMQKHSQNYFDTVVFLTFFILIGRWLEVYSKAKTADSVSMLGRLRPSEALLVTKDAPQYSPSQISGTTSGKAGDFDVATDRGLINSDCLEVGDIVLVRHGTSPPADGVISTGNSKFNESSLTGEARPVSKDIGDNVFTGTINIGDAVQVKITEIGGQSMLDKIVSIVREGQTKRAPIERVVDRILAYFVPVITALAIFTWIIWLILGETGALDKRYLQDSIGGWPFWSLEFAIAVFVVACPCGIGLAAPTALFVGSGIAAKHGILVRGGGEAFQDASDVDAVVFDKTGTLTQGGDLKVTDHQSLLQEREAQAAWAIVTALEETSTHPLAQALHAFAASKGSSLSLCTINITEQPGLGLKGTFDLNGTIHEAALGSEALMDTILESPISYFTRQTLSKWQSQANSIALLAIRTPAAPWHLALAFSITDPIRPSAFHALATLHEQGIPTYMLTGDNATTAGAVASTLQIPRDHVFANMMPVQKAEKIADLAATLPPRRDQGHVPFWRYYFPRSSKTATKTKEKATIAFIGDGTNDAPALTAAQVSVAVSHPGGSDIAVSSASFIILSSTPPSSPAPSPNPLSAVSSASNPLSNHADLSETVPRAANTDDHLTSLLKLLSLSRRVFTRVRFNFAWAVCYNAVLVPVAAGVLFRTREEGWRLGPVWGSLAMALSSVSVICSSLALRWEGSWDPRARK